MYRRDAVRHDDGPMMVLYWKADLPKFVLNNHPKYFILGLRLITGEYIQIRNICLKLYIVNVSITVIVLSCFTVICGLLKVNFEQHE